MCFSLTRLVYYTSAAQRPSKKVKIDFFFIHCVNSSIFLSSIVKLPFLSTRNKLRLLEWKGRLDLLMYVSRGSPDLRLDEVTNYPVNNEWPAIFSKSVNHPDDDGHLVKFVRALAHGQQVCKQFESRGPQEVPVNGKMWLQIGNMGESFLCIVEVFIANCPTAIDSTAGSNDGAMWIRSTGFDEAWENMPDRARL